MHIYHQNKTFKKGPKVYQRELKKLERKEYTNKEKLKIISNFTKINSTYLKFFVCRNPVSKLSSVYNYMKVLK